MKLTLISPYPDITAFGIRTISAYLKEKGHKTKLLFLPDTHRDNIIPGGGRYDEDVLDGILPLCDDSDIIGISLMTNFFDNAVQITRKIKERLTKPVLWGGVHPTVRPEECLEYADIVCIGEGEDAVYELLDKMENGKSYEDISNLWFKREGDIIKNPVRSLNPNLDIYPMPDYSLNEHYLMFESRIHQMTPELLKLSFKRMAASEYMSISRYRYQTMTGRGCPHKCTYCVNDTLRNLYGGRNYLRWRSTGHVMNELLWVKETMPYVGHISFSDDSFFARSNEKIKEFCIQYKEKIGLPFFALASPLTFTEEKLSLLVDAGLRRLQIGIEAGSKQIQELFNRKQMSNEKMIKVVYSINKYKGKGLLPYYDFIVDTPYETDDDKIESLRFISRMRRPFVLQTFSLVLYPGTSLYEKAKSDRLITDEKRDIYNKPFTRRKGNYLNFLFILAKNGWFPGWLLRFMVSDVIVWVLNRRVLDPFFGFIDVTLKDTFQRMKRILKPGMRKGRFRA